MNLHITAEKSNPVGRKWSQVQVKESETPHFDFGRPTRTPSYIAIREPSSDSYRLHVCHSVFVSLYEPHLVDSVGHVLSHY